MKLRHAIGALLVLQLFAGISLAEAQGKGRKSNVITAEEMAKSGADNAYDLIKTLRPAWFVKRGVSSGQVTTDAVGGMVEPGGLVVYVDGVRVGGPEELRNVTAERITEMRFLSATDATTKYGTGHTQGAIEVTTKR